MYFEFSFSLFKAVIGFPLEWISGATSMSRVPKSSYKFLPTFLIRPFFWGCHHHYIVFVFLFLYTCPSSPLFRVWTFRLFVAVLLPLYQFITIVTISELSAVALSISICPFPLPHPVVHPYRDSASLHLPFCLPASLTFSNLNSLRLPSSPRGSDPLSPPPSAWIFIAFQLHSNFLLLFSFFLCPSTFGCIPRLSSSMSRRSAY